MSSASQSLARSSFRPAARKKTKLRMAIDGPSGSGKTFTALRLAFMLGARVAVIDSEHGSSEKYQGEKPDGIPWEFAVNVLHTFAPTEYTAKIEEAAQYGFDVLVIDSLSHAWEGQDGALELVNKKGGNSYTAWKEVTPMHRRMVDAILRSPMHVICTMRSKTDYVLELDKNNKQVPRKVGMAPIQRPGMEYEFDVYGSLDWSHILTVSKSRCSALDGMIVHQPGGAFAQPLAAWLDGGEAVPAAKWTPTIASPETVGRIVAGLAELGRDIEKERATLMRRYTVPEFNQLTIDQAKDYEIRLQKDLDKKRKESNGSVTHTNGLPAGKASEDPQGMDRPQTLQEAMATSPGAPAAIEDLKPDAKCDAILIQKIAAERELLFDVLGLSNLPEHKQARDEKWKAILAKRNVTTAKELTNAQAAELLKSLETKVLDMHAAKNGSTEKK